MHRSASVARGPERYERLGKEPAATGPLNEELMRSASVPATRVLGSSSADALQRNPTTKKSDSKEKSHPLFSFLDFRRKKKTTARPEFARYLEYVKEGGMWDSNSNTPVIYYK